MPHGNNWINTFGIQKFAYNLFIWICFIERCLNNLKPPRNCSEPMYRCQEQVTYFSTRMGCCTIPYLGEGIRSCAVTIQNPCESVLSDTSNFLLSSQ